MEAHQFTALGGRIQAVERILDKLFGFHERPVNAFIEHVNLSHRLTVCIRSSLMTSSRSLFLYSIGTLCGFLLSQRCASER